MLLLKNACLFDGLTFREGEVDLLIDDGRVVSIASGMADKEGVRTIDIEGRILSPGLIDLHAHFRDPGQEWREDLVSGSRAAAAGGYTTAVAMANTDPALDVAPLVAYVLDKASRAGGARILPAGAATKGRKGKEMAEMGTMAEAGAVFFTDDGAPLSDAGLLRRVLLYSRDIGVRVMEHPEEPSLTAGGQVNEGRCSSLSGLKGWPASGEIVDVSRGIALVRETAAPLHFTHVSTAGALDLIREAKAEGLPVSCDVTPHHLTLTEEAVLESSFDSVFKVNPPLRSVRDQEALWQALADGTIDAIATDHAPYHEDEKDLPFQEASFGIASLECAVAVVLDAWKRRGRPLPLERLLALWTSRPASLLPRAWQGLGRIAEGSRADLTVLDLEEMRVVDRADWQSKGCNCPWQGMLLQGWPILTLVDGVPFEPRG
ncbi:dihydroorotase [Aminirod propionatiphilus]|uniref:Dihydroorotase n=1 Tax=Aminirod propionatiphilus TaxID=3415223 RepID=A0ACD1DZ78_9BACT|nr:dihydroorotase [Synergistota bacterium]